MTLDRVRVMLARRSGSGPLDLPIGIVVLIF